MKKTYTLRHRKKVIIPSRKKSEKPNYIDKMTFLVEYKGITKSYSIFFDDEPLSLKEMYNDGFIGEIEMMEPDGTKLDAEIVASPAGKDESMALGRFYFEVNMYKSDVQLPAKVKKFNFTKKYGPEG